MQPAPVLRLHWPPKSAASIRGMSASNVRRATYYAIKKGRPRGAALANDVAFRCYGAELKPKISLFPKVFDGHCVSGSGFGGFCPASIAAR